MDDLRLQRTRRQFLGEAGAVGTAGAALSIAPALGHSSAFAQDADDYKAMVCVYLEGGCDNWAALAPFDEGSHQRYNAARPQIAFGRGQLGATLLRPSNDLGGFQYALHPHLTPLMEMFGAGDLAVLQNVGNLVQPTTPSGYRSKSVALPRQLFSHNSQKALTQSGLAQGGNSGWGGRIADQVAAANARPEFTCINASANAIFLYGQSTKPYSISPDGANRLLDGADGAFGASGVASLIRSVSSATSSNVFRDDYAKLTARALQASEQMANVFSNVGDGPFSALQIADNELAAELLAVAKAIAGARSLGMRRQVFHVQFKNWDNHTGDRGGNGHFAKLAAALNGFWRTMRTLGLNQQVTTFTLSDFGRTLASNGDGSDHGWGTMSFVAGGAVKGGRIVGRPPVVGTDTADMVEGGRLVPSTSTDQLAATLASWMGVGNSQLAAVAPNLVNFAPQSWNLGLFG